MAAIANFVGWRHKSRDSTPCNWNTWRYWLFCCYYRHGRRVNSLPNHGTLNIFQDKHQTTQAFVGAVHFWSETSLVTSVVYSSAYARQSAPRFWELLRRSRWTHLHIYLKICSFCICDSNMAFKHISFLWSAKGTLYDNRWYGFFAPEKNISQGHMVDTAFLHGQKTHITTFGALGGLACDRIRYWIGKLVRKKNVWLTDYDMAIFIPYPISTLGLI